MPIQIDEVVTNIEPSATRSAGSGQEAQTSSPSAKAPREVEKLVRLLVERTLRVTAH